MRANRGDAVSIGEEPCAGSACRGEYPASRVAAGGVGRWRGRPADGAAGLRPRRRPDAARVLLTPLFPDCYVVPEVHLVLPGNRVRLPDLMLVADRPADGWVRSAPLLVVEVLSPSTRSEDTIRKSVEYAEGGIGQYWVVDPDLRTADLWRNVTAGGSCSHTSTTPPGRLGRARRCDRADRPAPGPPRLARRARRGPGSEPSDWRGAEPTPYDLDHRRPNGPSSAASLRKKAPGRPG